MIQHAITVTMIVVSVVFLAAMVGLVVRNEVRLARRMRGR